MSKIPTAFVLLERAWGFDVENQFKMVFRHGTNSKETSFHDVNKFENACVLIEDECFVVMEIEESNPKLIVELKESAGDGSQSVYATAKVDFSVLCEDIENEKMLSMKTARIDDIIINVKLRIRLENFGRSIGDIHPLHILFSRSYPNLLLRIFSFLDSNFLIKTMYFVSVICQRVICEYTRSLEVYNHNGDDIDIIFLNNFLNKFPNLKEFWMSINQTLTHEPFYPISFPTQEPLLERLTIRVGNFPSSRILYIIRRFKHLKLLCIRCVNILFSNEDEKGEDENLEFAHKNLIQFRIDYNVLNKDDILPVDDASVQLFLKKVFTGCEKLRIFSCNKQLLMDILRKLLHSDNDFDALLKGRQPQENDNWGFYDCVFDIRRKRGFFLSHSKDDDSCQVDVRSSYTVDIPFCVNSFFFSFYFCRNDKDGCLAPRMYSDTPLTFRMSVKMEFSLLNSDRMLKETIGKTVERNMLFDEEDSQHEFTFLNLDRKKEEEMSPYDFFRFRLQFKFPELLQNTSKDMNNGNEIEELKPEILRRKIQLQPDEIEFNFKPSTFENSGKKSVWTRRNFRLCGVDWKMKMDICYKTQEWDLVIEQDDHFATHFALILDGMITYSDGKKVRKMNGIVFYEDEEFRMESFEFGTKENVPPKMIIFTLKMHIRGVFYLDEYVEFKTKERTEIIGSQEICDFLKSNSTDSLEISIDVNNTQGGSQELKVFQKSMEWRFYYCYSTIEDTENENKKIKNWDFGIERVYDVLQDTYLFISFTISFPEIPDIVLRSNEYLFENDSGSWCFRSVILPDEIIQKKDPLKVRIDFQISESGSLPGPLDCDEMEKRLSEMYIRNNKFLGNSDLEDSVNIDFTITTNNQPYQLEPITLCGLNFIVEFFPLGRCENFLKNVVISITLQTNQVMLILARLKVKDLDFDGNEIMKIMEGGFGAFFEGVSPMDRKKKRWRYRIKCKLNDLRIVGKDYFDEDSSTNEEEGEEEEEREEEESSDDDW